MGNRIAVAIIFCAATVPSFTQTGPCRDLDGDGYLAGAGCVIQEDCNDLNPTTSPLAPELCNGFDDDCDGELDEGCNKVCADYEVAYRITVNEQATNCDIATADRSWAVMYSDVADHSPYYLTRYSFTGEQLAPDHLYSGDESVPEVWTSNFKLLWDGMRIAISWSVNDQPLGLFFRETGPWGVSNNAAQQLYSPGGGYYSNERLEWNGYEYAALYGRLGNSRLNRISAESEDLGEYVLFPGSDRTLAWTFVVVHLQFE